MVARANPGESNRRVHEAALACLRNAGFSVAEAIHAYSVQDASVYGYALQEPTLGLDTRDEWRDVANRQLSQRGTGPDAHPSTTEVLHHIAEHGFSHDEGSCSDSTSSSTDSSSGFPRQRRSEGRE